MTDLFKEVPKRCPKANRLFLDSKFEDKYAFFDSEGIHVLLTFPDERWGYGYKIRLEKCGEKRTRTYLTRMHPGEREPIEQKAFLEAFLMLEEFLNENHA